MPPKQQRGKRGQAPRRQRKRPTVERKRQGLPNQPKKSRASAAPISISRGTTVVSNNVKTMSYRRREFVQELISPHTSPTSSNTIVKLPLNPGISTVFPWLSTVSSFEQYKFKNLSFHFESSTSTSERGQIVMMTNVDAKDPEITSVVQAMSYSGAAVGRVWDNHTHRVPAQAVTRKNYIRTGTPPVNADLSLYDVGLFYLFTLGVQPSITLGTLWVEYDVEFYTPKLVILGRSLYIEGDRQTVSKSEPLGSEAKWKVDGNNSIQWSCPDGDPTACEFKISPNGLENFIFNISTLVAHNDEKKHTNLQIIDLVNIQELLSSHDTTLASPSTWASAFGLLQGKVLNKYEPFGFKVKYGDLAETFETASDIVPKMFLNMFA